MTLSHVFHADVRAVVAQRKTQGPAAATPAKALTHRWSVLEGMPKELDAVIAGINPDATLVRVDDTPAIKVDSAGAARVDVLIDDKPATLELPESALPTNSQVVGWALVAEFPVSLEVAGVILLMAMFGAVVLARRQIDLSEDERRVAAGLAPLLEDEESEFAGGDR